MHWVLLGQSQEVRSSRSKAPSGSDKLLMFPVLTALDIQDHGSIPWASRQSDNFVFQLGNYPRLTHLKLKNIHLELTGRLFCQLTKVTLDSCHIRPSSISADAFLDMLQCGQRLEELVLRNFMSRACSDPPSRHRHAAYLPRLRMLELVDDVSWIRHFTTFVQLPTRGQVELHGTLRDGDVDATGPLDPWALLVPHRLSDMGFARHAEQVTFLATTSARSYSLKYLSVSPSLTLTLRLPDRAETPSGTAVLATIRAHWQFQTPSALRMLTLRMDLRTAARADFELLFDAFPHLLLLRVASPTGDSVAVPSGLLDALASAPAVPQKTDVGGAPSTLR